MATPQEPEDEPAGDELPEPAPEGLSAEETLWRSIVENYGDRPEIEEPEIEVPPSLRDLDRPASLPTEDETAERVTPEPEEHFVPPDPPPLPMPPPARLLAWLGLFGVPTFVLVALVAKINVASWVGLLLMVWFVGGFVFLVASMKPGPGGDHDDGARL
ncbi:MAG: hypothetical protein JWR90_788 [Marmoricola sp.]|jgi:hypothetical protein|nr:hypothetical protein [Marmoricola sp.]